MTADQRGIGLIGSVAGLLVVSSVLALALQVFAHLETTSAVAAAGHDAARRVAARADGGPAAMREAVAEEDARLDRTLAPTTIRHQTTWARAAGSVVLTLEATPDGPLGGDAAAAVGLGDVRRRFVVRIEEPR